MTRDKYIQAIADEMHDIAEGMAGFHAQWEKPIIDPKVAELDAALKECSAAINNPYSVLAGWLAIRRVHKAIHELIEK